MSYQLAVERVFDAYAEEVFEAFTNADAQRVWMRDADDPNGILDNPRTTITANTANDNLDYGIEAVAGVTDGGGNTASGNGNPAQCLNVTCS